METVLAGTSITFSSKLGLPEPGETVIRQRYEVLGLEAIRVKEKTPEPLVTPDRTSEPIELVRESKSATDTTAPATP